MIWTAPKQILTPPDVSEDQDPCASSDGLALYFSSTRPAATSAPNIWISKRDSLGDDWGEPVPVEGINSDMRDVNPTISTDELQMWLARSDGGAYQLFEASRSSKDAPWSAPSLMPGLGGNPEGLAPAVTADGLVLYFNRSTIDLDVDIYRATRESTNDLFGVAEPLSGLNTDESDWDVFSHDDLFFILTRNGKLLTSQRETPHTPFQELTELPLTGADWAAYDPWISLDRSWIVYAADNGSKPSRLYEVQRE
jgi:hypothetical protein